MGTKRRTIGVDWKVPAQAIATIIVAALAYFGIDLDAEVSAAIAVAAGALLAAFFAPAPKTVTVPARDRRG